MPLPTPRSQGHLEEGQRARAEGSPLQTGLRCPPAQPRPPTRCSQAQPIGTPPGRALSPEPKVKGLSVEAAGSQRSRGPGVTPGRMSEGPEQQERRGRAAPGPGHGPQPCRSLGIGGRGAGWGGSWPVCRPTAAPSRPGILLIRLRPEVQAEAGPWACPRGWHRQSTQWVFNTHRPLDVDHGRLARSPSSPARWAVSTPISQWVGGRPPRDSHRETGEAGQQGEHRATPPSWAYAPPPSSGRPSLSPSQPLVLPEVPEFGKHRSRGRGLCAGASGCHSERRPRGATWGSLSIGPQVAPPPWWEGGELWPGPWVPR